MSTTAEALANDGKASELIAADLAASIASVMDTVECVNNGGHDWAPFKRVASQADGTPSEIDCQCLRCPEAAVIAAASADDELWKRLVSQLLKREAKQPEKE